MTGTVEEGTGVPKDAKDDEAANVVVLVSVGAIVVVVAVVAALLNTDANEDFPKRFADPNPPCVSDLGVPNERTGVDVGNEKAGFDSYDGGFDAGRIDKVGSEGLYGGGSDVGRETTGFKSTLANEIAGLVSSTFGD